MQKSHNLRHLDQRDSFTTKDVLEQIEKNKMVFLERASHVHLRKASVMLRTIDEEDVFLTTPPHCANL